MVSVRLVWRPSFQHPQERHHPLGSRQRCSSLAVGGGGGGVDQTHDKVVKTENTIHCILVSLVPGHEFPINCGSQHGWNNLSASEQELNLVPSVSRSWSQTIPLCLYESEMREISGFTVVPKPTVSQMKLFKRQMYVVLINWLSVFFISYHVCV